jgi:ribose transport system ATP-binding protein
MSSTPRNILELRNISMKFSSVVALQDVSLDIRKGEVHVLLGENGAGKSTLIKILSGVYIPNNGEMFLNGEVYKPTSPMDAIRNGIRVVYQEFNMLPYLSIAENIYYEKYPTKNKLVDLNTLNKKTEAILKEVGLDCSPKTPINSLGVAQKELVQIAKAISNEGNILILDEPTATLTPKEINRLFEIIRKLKEKGVTIIYISHRLQEVLEIGDRLTVLRNGEKIDTREVKGTTIPEIVKMMVGREIGDEYPFDPKIVPGGEIFRVEDLKYCGGRYPISFSLKRGELLGIAGLVGSGRTETMRAIFGADKKSQGKILVNDHEVNINNPMDAVNHKICLLTEDRKTQGLILDMPCYINITITNLVEVSHSYLIEEKKEHEISDKLIHDLKIQTPSDKQLVRNLSGGNQQKMIIAKWLFRKADILIFDEPTRGIDVGAKFEIYLLLSKLASQGKGIIIVSSDLPELIGICHRIVIFSNGKISGEVERDQFNQEKILSLAYQGYIQERL